MSMTTAPQAIRAHMQDDVAVALCDLASGDRIEIGSDGITLREPIAQGHKFALHALAADAPVNRFGARIGIASAPILPGAHVHSHNLRTALSGELVVRRQNIWHNWLHKLAELGPRLGIDV
jgi:altronate hydrolase